MNITKIINIIKYAMVIGDFIIDIIAQAEELFIGEKRGAEKKKYVTNEIKNEIIKKGASKVIANELSEFLSDEIDNKVAEFKEQRKKDLAQISILAN